MKNKKFRSFTLGVGVLVLGIVLTLIIASPSKPKQFDTIKERVTIYPDYVDTMLPLNIAPTNFHIEDEFDKYVTEIGGQKGKKWFVAGRDIRMNSRKWRDLLVANADGRIYFDVYGKKDGKWYKFQRIENYVSSDLIDAWVAYRIIEPGYDYGNRIKLAQREITSFDEHIFFDNRATESCINCHSFQNRHTERFLFHYRKGRKNPDGGTILVDGDAAQKVSGKIKSLGGSCSYPAWRPAGNLVAFSTNNTFQAFHTLSTQKIEVFDISSDLALLDTRKNEIKTITETTDQFETFPSWTPDGSTLYYCSATVETQAKDNKGNVKAKEIANRTNEFRYNLMKISFEERTGSFGKPELVVDASVQGRSAVFPRVSPDGRFLIYTITESGTFPIWRPEADLWIKDLTTGEERALDEINSPDTESFHNWDSSGRWLVFSSRREDGQYTRLYFTHIDEEGRASKPWVLPQKDPQDNRRRFKSYNVPELTVEPIRISTRTLLNAALEKPEETKEIKSPQKF